ncbi:hypothetical protein [Ferrimicrobium sp.]|uniref:hypothetical protein n=1 Tax=Ferrimicrobium sp. TaxID=2926050 RepID=UPI002630F7AC|nr:hypothetical protein [Ferrimicrobium sp.]
MTLNTAGTGAYQVTRADQVPDRQLDELTARDSAVLADNYGRLRDLVEILNEDVNEAHREVQKYDLDQHARSKAKRSVPTLLHELSTDRGMAWRDIARLVGVSVSAIRKWRNDGAASSENRLVLARLAAFLDLLDGFLVEDPAGWLEVPMADGYTVRHVDLYEAGRPDLLLDIAGLRIDEISALDRFDQEWRARYRSDFEVFEAGDGDLSIRKHKPN